MFFWWELIGTKNNLPGLFDYNAAIYGDALCLTCFVGAAVSFIKYDYEKIFKLGVNLFLVIMGGCVGLVIQASWILSDDINLNWTIPEVHLFNIAGWYHSIFFICMFAVISVLVFNLWGKTREKKDYCFEEKSLILIITTSAAFYLLCFIRDDYDKLVANRIMYIIVFITNIIFMGFIFCNKNIKFNLLKTVIVKGLILAFGLDVFIMEGEYGNVALSVAGALSMLVFNNREEYSIRQYVVSNIPMCIGGFCVFYYITGENEFANSILVLIIFLTLLLVLDIHIIQGTKLNAIGIIITIYIYVIKNVMAKVYVHECVSDIFIFMMSIMFTKGIKNIFDDVIDIEVKKNAGSISEDNFFRKKALVYTEIIGLAISLLIILWDWLDLKAGELYIEKTTIFVSVIILLAMYFWGKMKKKIWMKKIFLPIMIIGEYVNLGFNCYSELLKIEFSNISIMTMVVMLFALFSNIGSGLMITHGFRMNISTLRLKELTQEIKILSVLIGVGAGIISYGTTIILAINPSIGGLGSSIIIVFLAYWMVPVLLALICRMDGKDEKNEVVPNSSMGGVAQDCFMIMCPIPERNWKMG